MLIDLACLVVVFGACASGAVSKWYQDTLLECVCFAVLCIGSTAMFFWILKRDFVPVPLSLFLWGTAGYAALVVRHQVTQVTRLKLGDRRHGGWIGSGRVAEPNTPVLPHK